ALLGKDVLLLQETGLDVFRRSHHPRTGQRVGDVAMEKRGQGADHRRQQSVDLALLAEDELTVVPGHALHGIAAIDSAATPAVFATLLVGGIAGKDDASGIKTKRREQAQPELMGGPDVEGPRDPDAKLRSGT